MSVKRPDEIIDIIKIDGPPVAKLGEGFSLYAADLLNLVKYTEQLEAENADLRKGLRQGPLTIVHGKNCPKKPHVTSGYLHPEHDDGPFYVDGITYCGRCHEAI